MIPATIRYGLFGSLACLLLVLRAQPEQLNESDAGSEAWRQHVLSLPDQAALRPLLARAGGARLVLIGEASHGTSEFYRWRAEISRRLIAENHFDFVVVEGDWVLCQILNSYALDLPGAPSDARQALLRFDRWPLWMWANREVLEFAEWLREWNQGRPVEERVGFYGMDVYGMWDSLDAVLDYFRNHHPERLGKVDELYAGLAIHHGDGHSYARMLAQGGRPSAEQAAMVVEKIRALPEPAGEEARRRRFMAEQNAWVVKYGERHFRGMLERGPESWNQRVEHMKKTVARLLDNYGAESRGIVWAHNTHIGDARATTMAIAGQRNIGQLARQRWGGEEVFAIGFATYRGEVMAARSWGGEAVVMTVPEAMPGSLEEWLWTHLEGDSLLLFDDRHSIPPLTRGRGHRAIGVIYHPERERPGNYVSTIAPERYDALLFIRRSGAVEPLHRNR